MYVFKEIFIDTPRFQKGYTIYIHRKTDLTFLVEGKRQKKFILDDFFVIPFKLKGLYYILLICRSCSSLNVLLFNQGKFTLI